MESPATNPITELLYEKAPVRTKIIDGVVWFVALDVCAILEIKNARDAVAGLNSADVATTDVRSGEGQHRKTNLVNESGLYGLIFQSRKPEAKAFQRWVTSEVLPEIRKNGFYSASKTPEGRFLDFMRQLTAMGVYPNAAAKMAVKISAVPTLSAEADHIEFMQSLIEDGVDPNKAAEIARRSLRKRTREEQLGIGANSLTHKGHSE